MVFSIPSEDLIRSQRQILPLALCYVQLSFIKHDTANEANNPTDFQSAFLICWDKIMLEEYIRKHAKIDDCKLNLMYKDNFIFEYI